MMSSAENSVAGRRNTVRVFFALWPDTGMRAALSQLGNDMHALCGGRLTRAESMHMTLVFLGEVEAARIAELQALAARLQCAEFDFELSRTGWWQQNHVAWVAPATMPLGLIALVSELQTQLKNTGFAVDGRAYAPHVTLLRKANCPPELTPMAALQWVARDFVLVKSAVAEHGSDYEIIGRWPLLPATQT
ncbi:MAG: RNA 2',3'-cyclic phosphodiesterase [Sulfuriferula sp.]